MPNGNVLVDVWEWITPAEAIAAGRTITTNGFWSGAVVELHPDFGHQDGGAGMEMEVLGPH